MPNSLHVECLKQAQIYIGFELIDDCNKHFLTFDETESLKKIINNWFKNRIEQAEGEKPDE